MVKDAPLNLTSFLADLRAELEAAQKQSNADATVAASSSNWAMRLGVEEITVTVEVAHVATASGEVTGKLAGKFLVIGSAEGSTTGSMERQRSGTQTLTLKLKPRLELATADEDYPQTPTHRGLDVSDSVSERPPVPGASRRP